MMNPDWKAKCDAPNHILVRPHGSCSYEHGFDVPSAIHLRDQLTAAIEEAKRQSDPFWPWWQANRVPYVSTEDAKLIWDAATKAAREGK